MCVKGTVDWNQPAPADIPQVLAVADTIPSRLFLWRNKMNEEIMNDIQSVRPKDQFTFSLPSMRGVCRNIEGCVMVESLDAYRRWLISEQKVSPSRRNRGFSVPLLRSGASDRRRLPIYMLKTNTPNGSCIFTDGRCSVYSCPYFRTCRIYPLTVGPRERPRF